jgi:undecaprenyl diphosphate synthase
MLMLFLFLMPSKSGALAPQHVAIIPDGGRRWAEKNKVSHAKSYLKGMQAFEAIVRSAVSKNIQFLSLWVLSHDNWEKRSPEWRAMFLALLKQYLKPKCEAMFAQNIGVKIIGDECKLDSFRNDIEAILKNNPPHPKMTVVFFLCYSGSRDLDQAVKKLIAQNDDPKNIQGYLQTRQAGIPDPDLLIRTSNVRRLSNFMMQQCAHTELYFSKKFWPDFTPADFGKALTWYEKVEQRFGK